MKRCPTCHEQFEEQWLSFCTHDGTTLIEDLVNPDAPPPPIMAPAVNGPEWNQPSPEFSPASPEWRPPPQVVAEWQPPPPPLYVQPQSKSIATAAMVLGIISVTVGWLCFGPIPVIASIILGAVALSQIKKTPDLVAGKQMAWTGIITGSITILLYLGVMIFYIFVIVMSNA